MSKENIVSYSLNEIRQRIANGESQTDWARVDAMTDADIEAAMRDDPDWADLVDFDCSNAVAVYPQGKTAISIRLDPDVLSFFKASGKGYQTRINEVLRRHVQSALRKSAKRKAAAE